MAGKFDGTLRVLRVSRALVVESSVREVRRRMREDVGGNDLVEWEGLRRESEERGIKAAREVAEIVKVSGYVSIVRTRWVDF
jgi:hypothetical protein